MLPVRQHSWFGNNVALQFDYLNILKLATKHKLCHHNNNEAVPL
jgi:hypothetical protein